MHRRLVLVTLTHAVLASFGDIAANVFNFMTVPLNVFFNETAVRRYGYYNMQAVSMYNSLTASLFFMGIIAGGLTMGRLMDSFGRKENGVILRSSLGILQGVCAISSRPLGCVELFFVSNFLAGVVCAYKNVLVIYLAECSPVSVRGFTSMAVGSGAVLIVSLIAPLCIPSLLGSGDRWLFLPALCSLMALAHLLIALFFPQSPKHLFIHDRNPEAAEQAIIFYHGSLTNFRAVEEEYIRERDLLRTGHANICEVMSRRTLRWSLFIVMVCGFVQNTSAVNVKSQYQTSMLMSYGFDQTQVMFAMTVISLTAIPVCILAPFLVENMGRRPLFLIVSSLCCLEWFFIGVAQFLTDLSYGQSLFTAFLSLMGCFLGTVATMLGLLVLTPVIVSEVCSHPMRGAATQASQIFPVAFAAFSVAMYPSMVSTVGCTYHLLMLTFSGICLTLLCCYLPEAKGLAVDEIVKTFASTPRQSQNGLLRRGRRNSYGSVPLLYEEM